MKVGTYYGIDFGTTNTAVVAIHYDQYGKKIDLLGEDGQYPFASMVAIPKKNDGDMLFGKYVKEHRYELANDYYVLKSLKSYLGDKEELYVNGSKYEIVEITSKYLNYIRNYIKNSSNNDIKEAVLALPVDFSPLARRQLYKAAELAGIKVNGFISESTGAYLACKDDVKAYSNAMVIDWGGGTLDVSILDLENNKVKENSILGYKIGGDDIDLEVAKRVHAMLVNKTKIQVSFDQMSPEEKDQIISKCEEAKINLSDFDDTTILLRKYGEFGTKNMTLEYDAFEDMLKPLINKHVLGTIDKTMALGDKTKTGIDIIIPVGGSCNLRPIENMLTNIFGQDKIYVPDDAQWVVAKGAAIVNVIGNNSMLCEDLCVLLSDTSTYPILKKGIDKVGSVTTDYKFSLTEDSPVANFIFTNADNTIRYGTIEVKTKGFLKENLTLKAEIAIDQIAKITIKNSYMGSNYEEFTEVNKLKYYYDLTLVE